MEGTLQERFDKEHMSQLLELSKGRLDALAKVLPLSKAAAPAKASPD